jgi:hypothetical protein
MSTLARVWRGIRVALGVGLVTLVLLVLVLEGGYAGYHAARRAAWGHRAIFDSADHPFWHEAWFAGWLNRISRLMASAEYDPYRGWRLPAVSSPEINIDSAGIRATRQAGPLPPGARHLLMLGGSTMWGYSSRDSGTIPSLVAAALARRGVTDVQVDNLATLAYNVTQDATTLLLQLRNGRTPAAVVSLDGINEVGIVEGGGTPGQVFEETRIRERFRRNFWKDVAYLRFYLEGAVRAEFMARGRLGLDDSPPVRSTEELCSGVGRNYVGATRVMEVLSREYGFPIYFLTTPTLARSGKPRSRWEQSLAGDDRRLADLTVRCGAITDSLMADRRGRTYFPLDTLFDHDTSSVFIDQWGHLSAVGNRAVAERIADLVLPALRPEARP